MNKKLFLITNLLLFSSLMQSCGSSIRDLTDPSHRQKEENKKLEQKIKEENRKKTIEAFLEQVKKNKENAKFDLNDEASACKKAKFFAVERRVNLDSCSLKNNILELSATNPENKLSHNESFDTTKAEDDLLNQIDSNDSNLSSFFDSMVYAISVSRG